jgi:hypothetical protein
MTLHAPFRITLRRIVPVGLTLACLVMPSRSGAQDDGQKPATSAPAVPAGAAVPTVEAKPVPRFNDNVKVDVTITDQAAANKPIIKTLTAIVGNRQEASIRTIVQLPVVTATRQDGGSKVPANWRTEELPLDVDLFADMTDASHVRVGLSLKYRTITKMDDVSEAPPWTAGITQKFSVFLESGKALVISQSADAATDRKVTIEVKATILK